MSPGRKGLIRALVAVFVALAIGFFAYTIIDAWNATNGELPSLARILAASALWIVGLIVGATAWATMIGGDRRVDHGAALLVSQLAKYVPGGVWQASGQVGLARALGVRLQRGATAFSVLAVTQAVAGCTFGLVLAAAWTDVDVLLRVAMAVGALGTLVFIDRRWMVWALHKIPKTRSASAELVPPQRVIVIGWALSLVTVAATSCAYLVLLGSFGPVHHPLLVIGDVRDRVDDRIHRNTDPVRCRHPRSRARHRPARHLPGIGHRRGERLLPSRLGRDRRCDGGDRVAPGAAESPGGRIGQPQRRRVERRDGRTDPIAVRSSFSSCCVTESVAYAVR